ncbi:MAG: glycosyltransferase family 2 protein [Candidatus Binatia bacterium]
MTSAARVSVITIFHDAERFLRDAVESVIAQSFDDWELILVDDGSTDGSTRVALEYAAAHPSRVRYLEHPGHENLGRSASRNLGLARARGELVAFLDSDDVWLDCKLGEQVAVLAAEPQAALVYGTRELWTSWNAGAGGTAAAESMVPQGIPTERLFPPPELFLLTFGLRRATVPGSDVMVRRDVARRLGGFENAFRGMFDDQPLLCKIYLSEPVFVSSRCWTRYRQHPDSCVARWAEAGADDTEWRRFLSWIDAYVAERRIADRAVRRAVRRLIRQHRHPTLSRLLAAISRRAVASWQEA